MSGMERLQRMFADDGGSHSHAQPDSPTLDTSEQVYISSLALLKMLKHVRAGVPMRDKGREPCDILNRNAYEGHVISRSLAKGKESSDSSGNG